MDVDPIRPGRYRVTPIPRVYSTHLGSVLPNVQKLPRKKPGKKREPVPEGYSLLGISPENADKLLEHPLMQKTPPVTDEGRIGLRHLKRALEHASSGTLSETDRSVLKNADEWIDNAIDESPPPDPAALREFKEEAMRHADLRYPRYI